ncbi:MAG: protein BatD [Spirochaetes bacterium]|nr:protein BatD [Spirochaetota bacterium]
MIKIGNIVGIIVVSCAVYAAEVNIRADANPKTVGVNEPFAYSIVVDGTDVRPDPPRIEGVDVVGTSMSQSVQIINGQFSQSITYHYTLVAHKEGPLVLPEVTINAKGQTFKSEPVTVTVSKTAPQRQAAPQASQDPFEEFERVFRGAPQRRRQLAEKDVFVMTTVSKKTVYVNEALFLNHELYAIPRISGGGLAKAGDREGFWVENVTNNPLVPKNKQHNGTTYNTAVIQSDVLFPVSAGTKNIGANEYAFDVAAGFFDQRIVRRGQDITITVLPLPAGAPADFCGAIGSFDISVSVNTASVKANNSFVIRVEIRGSGNAKTIVMPDIKKYLPSSVKVFETKEQQRNYAAISAVTGAKSAEYVIVPALEGVLTIPAVTISYFDPSAERYISKRSLPLSVRVLKGEPGEGPVSATRNEVRSLGDDIRHIKPDKTAMAVNSGFLFFTPLPYIYLIFLVAVLAGFIIYKREEVRLLTDHGYRRKKHARRTAQRYLKQALEHHVAGNSKEYAGALEKALFLYLTDRLVIPKGSLMSDIENELVKRSVTPAIIERVREHANTISYARYAPGGADSGSGLHKETETLIHDLEDVI